MLYLVDASVFIFRAWFSVPVDVADRDGNPVNAVLGFARFLAELLERNPRGTSPSRSTKAWSRGIAMRSIRLTRQTASPRPSN